MSRSAGALRHVVVVGLALAALAGCSTIQREADDEAARIADQVLPAAIDAAIAEVDAKNGSERLVTAETLLTDPEAPIMDGQGGVVWVVRGRDATTIRVDIYRRWESGSLLPPDQGEAAWGLVCRSYDVTRSARSIVVECPAGTPRSP
ncbi:hypothetical protein [Aeromicrobium sp. CF3.5]|uniref:hypothetical protein n=1 Tax=Aeromicrobium sp. CF3.5 TaxID=3373078 RepID=UPI003EE541F9